MKPSFSALLRRIFARRTAAPVADLQRWRRYATEERMRQERLSASLEDGRYNHIEAVIVDVRAVL